MEQQTPPSCANCKTTAASLQACSRCKSVQYCGRDCQKADWKAHKKTCSAPGQSSSKGPAKPSGPYSASRVKNLEKQIPKPFTRLDQGMYLHERSETDVFKLLIDSFRIREADDFNFEKKKARRSVYAGAPSSIEPFREYLAKAATRQNLLPSWWTEAKVAECTAYGEIGAWSDLRMKLVKQDAIDHYGEEKMPMQLRMFAELVYGCGTMGQSGKAMRKAMMDVEGQNFEYGPYHSLLNISH